MLLTLTADVLYECKYKNANKPQNAQQIKYCQIKYFNNKVKLFYAFY